MPEKIAGQIIYPPLIISVPEWGISDSKKTPIFFSPFFFFFASDFKLLDYYNLIQILVDSLSRKKSPKVTSWAPQNPLHMFLKQKDNFFMHFCYFQPFRLLCLERKHISGVMIIWLVWDYGLQIADFGYGCLAHLKDFSINSNNRLTVAQSFRRRDKKLCLLKQKIAQKQEI